MVQDLKKLAALLLCAWLVLPFAFAQEPTPPADEEFVDDDCDPTEDEDCAPAPVDPTPTAASVGAAPKIGATPQALQVSVNLTGNPLTGTCPYQINLSWTATNASVCTKTGAWSGNAGASGSEELTVNSATATYTLTCSSNTDTRTITWANPTNNTDGSAATLSGNKVYHAASAANIETANPAIKITPAKTTYLLAGLPAGPRVVGVKATSSTGVDSAMSALASTSIVLPTGADTVQATCTPPAEPRPPTAVTIASTVWDVRRAPGQPSGYAVGRDVGTIALEVGCIGDKPIISQGNYDEGTLVAEYWSVPKAKVSLYRKPRSTMVLGQCRVRDEWRDYWNYLETQS